MSDVQFGHDGSISMERMVQVYNNELANTWGNLVNRVFNMTKKYFGGKVPALDVLDERGMRQLVDDPAHNPLRAVADGLYAEFDRHMGLVDFTSAVAAVQKLAQAANLYVDDMAPWTLAKAAKAGDAEDATDADRAAAADAQATLAAVMYNLLEAIRIVALYLAPLAPNTSAEVWRRLALGDVTAVTDIEAATAWGQLPAGNPVEVGDPLFPRLDVDELTFE
jgi:methionyl-tRNA synthetase